MDRGMQKSENRQKDAEFYSECGEFKIPMGNLGEIILEAQGKNFPATH